MRKALLILLALGPVVSYAQMVKGLVTDESSNQSIPGVLIHWKSSQISAVTDEIGHYEIASSEIGDSLFFQFLGYYKLGLLWNGQATIDIKLQPITNNQSAVIIESEQSATKIHSLDAQKFQTLGEKELCKAACCSLAESFETNASVDASFTDAITGTRQIKMLGLDGKYSSLLYDNIPGARGLSSLFGLASIPGPWINEISIGKGVGSVQNGYESVTGQLNVAHKGIEMKERLFLNFYSATQGRLEGNAVLRQPVGKAWNTMLYAHGSSARLRFDMNKDGFLDNPLFKNFAVRNQWTFMSPHSGWRGEYALSHMVFSSVSGQFDFDPKEKNTASLWGANISNRHSDFTAKTGYIFDQEKDKSFGSQISVSQHSTNGMYGLRNHEGKQYSARGNFLFATRLNKSISETSGVCIQSDSYRERLDSANFNRHENVLGLFTEWKINIKDRFNALIGGRIDNSSVYGVLVTPRLHLRYSLTEKTTLKLSAGKGYRSPNIVADNIGILAGNRTVNIQNPSASQYFGLALESAWNYGAVLIHKFKLNHRDASFTVDGFVTNFNHQVVVDWENTGVVRFYNLAGKSYSNTVQAEFIWSPFRRTEFRGAYRWVEAKTQYGSSLLDRPLVAKHRAFANTSFETKASEKGAKWVFDVTARWMGSQRIPFTSETFLTSTPSYWIFNAQVAYFFSKKIEAYIGGENLGNFVIGQAIVSANDTSNPAFDASMIWGPVFGRMGYVGLRWRIGASN